MPGAFQWKTVAFGEGVRTAHDAAIEKEEGFASGVTYLLKSYRPAYAF